MESVCRKNTAEFLRPCVTLPSFHKLSHTIAEAKRRGKVLGVNGRHLAAKNRKAADEFAARLRAKLDAGLLGDLIAKLRDI